MSALIKAGSTRTIATGFANLNLRDIAREAEAHLSGARARGNEVVDAAVAEANRQRLQILEKARQEGYAAGLKEGRKAGVAAALAESRKRFDTDQTNLVALMTDAVKQFSENREQFIAAARRDVLLLAVAIARKIVSAITESNASSIDVATEAAGEALNLVRTATDVEVRVNPDDAGGMETFVEDLKTRLRDGRHVRVIEDAEVSRGGVRVVTADTTVDGSIESRVNRIAQELVAGWRERSKELSLES
jgi:flagellar assembly protein FliH